MAATEQVTTTEQAAATEAAATEPAAAQQPMSDQFVAADAPPETYKDIPVGFTKGGFPYRGDPNAPVVMVEYSDFQCPFCIRYFVQTEPAINDAYVRDGKVRVVFRDFPIQELHPNAPAAHLAALCVADQGAAKYWAMHEKVFQTQSEWSNSADPAPVFERLAQEVGADVTLYKECLASGSKQAFLDAAIAEGRAAGVSGTPSFQFFGQNGDSYLMVGAQPFEQFALYADALAKGEKPPVPAAEPTPPPGDARDSILGDGRGFET